MGAESACAVASPVKMLVAPGPEVANMPIKEWAAGAGLDAVLEKDEEMLPYMFPNGVNQETVYDRFDSDKMYDRTIMPIAIQFPDWKHWLPMIHPMDAYSNGNFYQQSYDDRALYVNLNSSKMNPEKGYEIFRQYSNEGALYFSDDFELSDDIKINAGLRYSSFQHNGDVSLFNYIKNDLTLSNDNYRNIEPRLSLRYKLNTTSSIKGSYSENYQYIHLVCSFI